MSKTPPAVRIKRVYEAPSPRDGTRILVDRLWPRGVKKSKAATSQWMKEIAPSNELTLVYSAHDQAHNQAVVLREILSQ